MADEFINIEDELFEAEEVEVHRIRNPKLYLERHNPLEKYEDWSFKTKYRMTKDTANVIINLARGNLNTENERGLPISLETQVLATIRYLATDAYGDDRGIKVYFEQHYSISNEILVAEQHGLSQSTLSKIVKRVVETVAGHINEFIQFPEG